MFWGNGCFPISRPLTCALKISLEILGKEFGFQILKVFVQEWPRIANLQLNCCWLPRVSSFEFPRFTNSPVHQVATVRFRNFANILTNLNVVLDKTYGTSFILSWVRPTRSHSVSENRLFSMRTSHSSKSKLITEKPKSNDSGGMFRSDIKSLGLKRNFRYLIGHSLYHIELESPLLENWKRNFQILSLNES